MNWINALLIALSTYSILPVPQVEWKQDSLQNALCFLPVVGVLVGGVLLLWQRLCLFLHAETAVFAAVAAVLPLLVTGGIHMDGMMDAADALASRQPKERKLEIMKDSHTGAFAVLWCAAFLLLCFGFYSALYETELLWPLWLCFVLSRALCIFCAFTLPNARGGGMLSAFTQDRKNKLAIGSMALVALLSIAGMVWLQWRVGLCCGIIAAGYLLFYRRLATREFGGVTGDTSGFFVQTCELLLLMGVWLGGKL